MSHHVVTGAAGFIGANLVARLKAQGEWVRAVDLKAAPEREHLYTQADEVWLDRGMECDLRIEVSDREEFDAFDALSTGRGYSHILPDVIWHMGADHGGAGYFHGPADFKAADNNLAIDRNVRRAAQRTGARLFFAGSACSYPVAIQGNDACPVKESDFGQGPAEACYGEAKRMSTIMFDAARKHGHDFRVGIFSTIYGPGQEYREPRAKFPTALCRKLIENPKRVEVWGDGSQVRTFLFIDDALDRILTVMQDGAYHGPVNIASDEEVTIRECCEWTAWNAGATPEWVWTDGPTGVAHRAADNGAWNRRYGQTPLIPAREGFLRTYDWLRAELGQEAA